MVSISGITSTTKAIYNYGRRFLNTAPELVLGSAAEATGQAMRTTSGSLFDKAAAGWHTLESAGKGSFFKTLFKEIKTFVPDIKSAAAEGAKGLSGAAKLKGGTKGLFQSLGKKWPFIGAILMMACELPNIWKATKEQGLLSGAKETVKSAAKLIGGGLGSAVGSAIIPIPFVGTMVGWLAGEWLAGKIVGKSYSEKKAEAEEKLTQAQEEAQPQVQEQMSYPMQAQNQNTQVPFGSSYNPYIYNETFNNPYKDDIFINQLPFNSMA